MSAVLNPVSTAPARVTAHVLPPVAGSDLVPLDPAAAVTAPLPADVWCALAPDVRSRLLRSGGVDLTPDEVVSLGDAGGVAVLTPSGRWDVAEGVRRFIAQLTRLLRLVD